MPRCRYTAHSVVDEQGDAGIGYRFPGVIDEQEPAFGEGGATYNRQKKCYEGAYRVHLMWFVKWISHFNTAGVARIF